VHDLGLALPPQPMPGWRGTRPLKRWRYLGAYCPELMLCVGEAHVGPMRQRFWAVAQPDGSLAERTTIGRGGVRVDGSRFRVDTRDVRIDVTVEEDGGVESVHPSGRDGYVWTRKQAGVPVHGEVRVGARIFQLDCLGAVDETAGYHERRTSWCWSAGVGRAVGGERLAWNLVDGVHDSRTASERSVWVDGVAHEVGPASFADDLSRVSIEDGGSLEFKEWSAREHDTNLLVLRSYYRQPFGSFAGDLRGDLRLAEGYGVMEHHDVRW
jgi:hypothetical protein